MEFARTEERFAPIIRQGDQQAVADALPHVSAGITAGLLRGEDPVVLTRRFSGVTAHLARVLVLERGEDADRVAEAAIAFCRRGMYVRQCRIDRGGSHDRIGRSTGRPVHRGTALRRVPAMARRTAVVRRISTPVRCRRRERTVTSGSRSRSPASRPASGGCPTGACWWWPASRARCSASRPTVGSSSTGTSTHGRLPRQRHGGGRRRSGLRGELRVRPRPVHRGAGRGGAGSSHPDLRPPR